MSVAEVERKKRGRPPAPKTMLVDLTVAFESLLGEIGGLRWPNPKYLSDPVGFCRDILGFEPWFRQRQILEAVRDHDRVAVSSGHKCGKSTSAVSAGLWYYASFPDARVIATSATDRQVNEVLWRELQMLVARSGRCVDCKLRDPEGPRPCPHSALIDGKLGANAKGGLRSEDFREFLGFTAKEAEAVAGLSGKHVFWIIDEASGVSDSNFEAIEGNRAGGAKALMLSNPTKTVGQFFRAFNDSKARKFYFLLQVSSEESPNVTEGRDVIPGLATRAWVEEKREEWGEDSPLYKVRVKGEFVLNEDGKIFSIAAIAEATDRWRSTPEEGRLFIGLDPAGPTGSGDETVFAVRRGAKLIELLPFRGLDEDGHLAQLLALLEKHERPRETPVVVLDREGAIGAALHSRLYAYLDGFRRPKAPPFEYIAVKASAKAERNLQVFPRLRDELAANLERWFRTGAIPEDAKLEKELHALEWIAQIDGRIKVTPKDDLRRILERSPDRYDALALAVWEPLSLRADSEDANLGTAAQAVVAREVSRRAPVDEWEEDEGPSRPDPYRSGRRPDYARRR